MQIFTYMWGQIKLHPLAAIVTTFNVVIFLISAYSLGFVDYNNTRQQAYANAAAIKALSNSVSSDNDSIAILQQIAKDQTVANANFSTQLSTLNNNFTLYLENQKK